MGFFDDDEVVMGDLPSNPENPADLAEPQDPLQEESQEQQQPDGPQEDAFRGAHKVWNRLVEEAANVAVRTLPFVETVSSLMYSPLWLESMLAFKALDFEILYFDFIAIEPGS